VSNWESTATLAASSVQTTSGTGAAVDLSTRDRLLRQTLAVSSATANSTLTVRLESSADGATGWKQFGAFTPATTTGAERLSFVSPERYVRAAWTITGGAPSFTFAVSGTQGICFANLEQLAGFGLPNAAISNLVATTRAEALAATTELASGILAARYTLPILLWGTDLAQATCKITAYDLLSVRGFNPDGDDKNVRMRWQDAMDWLKAVAEGSISPVGLVDSPTDDDGDDSGSGAEIVTHAPRAWR
jgi:phage gp36-like protein